MFRARFERGSLGAGTESICSAVSVTLLSVMFSCSLDLPLRPRRLLGKSLSFGTRSGCFSPGMVGEEDPSSATGSGLLSSERLGEEVVRPGMMSGWLSLGMVEERDSRSGLISGWLFLETSGDGG